MSSDTSSRVTSPKRARRSSSSTASSRSSASSETSRSASRVTRKSERSRISIPGKSSGRWCASTCSIGTRRPPRPTGRKRGSPSGTLTRAKRSSPVSGSRTKTATLIVSGEMYGKGWPGPTASGVSTGKISLSKRLPSSASSPGSRSSIRETTIRSAASAGQSSSFQTRACSAYSSSTRRRASASAWCGVSPSGERTVTPTAAWPTRPAIRTMKNSSSICAKIERKNTRSSNGTSSSRARSSNRAS